MRRSALPAVVLGLIAAAAFPVQAGEGDDHGHGHAPESKTTAKPSKPEAGKPGAPDAQHNTKHDNTPDTKTESKLAGKPESKHAADDHDDAPAGKAGGHGPAPARPAATTETKPAGEPDRAMTADDALKMLADGNARWVADQEKNPNTEPARRSRLADAGQKPQVTILTCADSRIPVERVFDRGVGDLFVIRVAGNVAGTSEAGTIEYGVGHLKTPLLVVMGHTKCGAVAAAASGAEMHGKVGELVSSITPAVERAKRNNPNASSEELVPLAVRENVWQSIFDLYRSSAEIREKTSAGELRVVGAVYDIATGKVEFLGEHPWQSELIEAMNARAASRGNATAGAGEHGDNAGH